MFITIQLISTILIGILCLIMIGERIYNHILYHLAQKKFNKALEDTPIEPIVTRSNQSNTGYDTESFKQRMEEFRKEYYDDIPLYDVPVYTPKGDETTGVEIITEEYEEFMERKMRI